MFKIIWDRETGGVLLDTKVTKDTLGISPRPVFFEELDFLGLTDLGWTYPQCKEPIMWAVNKQYWYRGTMLFEAKGANMYDAPMVVFAPGIRPMALEAIDIDEMLRRNSDLMFLLESEAIEFIRDTYYAYSQVNRVRTVVRANEEVDYEELAERLEKKTKQKMAVVKEDCDSFDIVPLNIATQEGKRVLLSTKIDRFIASFSGGKDSQVVLDLCTRAIPPSEFEVIYSDTGYELPPSLELYEEVKRYYGERFPALKFSITRNHESVLNYWDKIGTPSDTHRWCCSVMKTAPLYRSLKVEGNKQAKVLAFDGVRAEESVRRSSYERIGKGKHVFAYNAHPIISWNNIEIFLYIFRYGLTINKAYRLGKARVGCIICPFSTAWDDCIINRNYSKELQQFTDRIISYASTTRIQDVVQFIKDRKWKLKILGNTHNLPTVKFSQSSNDIKLEITNARLSIFDWLPALCDYTLSSNGDIKSGELKFKTDIYTYRIEENIDKGRCIFEVYSIKDVRLILLMKRLAQKTAYCIQCEVCEVDCPTGALSIDNKITINKTKCIHCHRCITSHDRGCIVADCNRMVKDSDTTLKIYGYKKFGLREEWLDDFMADPPNFWESKTWGGPMYEAFKRWGKDALLLDSKNEITEFGSLLQEIYVDNPTLVWEILWINLSYNSFIVNRFTHFVDFGQLYNAKTLQGIIADNENVGSLSTLSNACLALTDMITKSIIGDELLQGVEMGKSKQRQKHEELSVEAIAYSLFRYSEEHDTREFRMSDLYSTETEDGPYHQFGISKTSFTRALRYLSASDNRILIAELNMGLDHIKLDDNLSSTEVLRKLVL